MLKLMIGIALALSLCLTGCNDTQGTLEILDFDPPQRGPGFDFDLPQPGPRFEFGTPMTFGPLPGEALGLAVGDFDGDGDTDAATFLDTDPGSLLSGGTIFVQQSGLDPSVPLRLDITGGSALSRLKTLLTTPAGNLLGVGSGLVANRVGAVRFRVPLTTGASVPLGLNRQTMDPFAEDIPKNATLSPCNIAGQPTFAVPGLWDGRGSGVLFLAALELEPIGGEAGFLSTTNEGILLPEAVCKADFNGDGRDDLVVVGDTQAVLYIQSTDGTFTASDSISPSRLVRGVCCGQLDSDPDQIPDIAIITESAIFVYLNGDFTTPSFERPIGVGREIQCADLNGDGFSDLFGVVGSNPLERVFVSLGDGTGAFRRVAEADVGDDETTRLRNVRSEEFSGEDGLDLVVLKSSDTESEIIWIPQQ